MKADKLKLFYYKNNVSGYFPKGEFQIKLDDEAKTPFLVAPIPLGGSVESVEERVKRAVDCVNAMQGIEDPQKLREAWQVCKDLEIDAYHKLKAEHDELRKLFSEVADLLIRCRLHLDTDTLSEREFAEQIDHVLEKYIP